jgi:4-carboxymuconolactone decarboxylase
MVRIAYVNTEDADPRVRPIFEEYEERTGSVPNLIRALARDPDLLESLLPFLRRMFGVSRISPDLKAIVMLHVSKANYCPYCYHDHAPTLAQLGYSPEQIEALGEALPTEELYAEVERAVIRFADEVTRFVGAGKRTFEEARRHLTEEQMVELTALAAACNMITRLVMTLDVEPNA